MVFKRLFAPLKATQGDQSRLIHKTEDSWGPILVIDKQDQRILSFGSIYEQSRMDLLNPLQLQHKYTQIMFLVLAFTRPHHVTLLGLGGGCLLRSLYHCLPDSHFHVIELREIVYQLAVRYFGIPDDERVKVTIEDAAIVLQQEHDQSTDLIMADMFFSEGVNPLQTADDFLVCCHAKLSDQGWLVLNFHQQTELSGPFFEAIRYLFDCVIIGTSSNGNHVLFAGKSRLPGELLQYRNKLRKWEAEISNHLSEHFDRLIRFR